MRLAVPYEKISADLPSAMISNVISLITESDWYEYDYRKPMFSLSQTTSYDSIMIRHSSEYNTATIRNMPAHDKYAPALAPILDFIKQFYQFSEYVAFLARLGAGGTIALHEDGGEFLERVHRLHIPIKTNDKCFYLVDEERVQMATGTLYEIDNQRRHGVVNEGAEDRIHLIVNVYGKRLGASI
jgi:hypothetical protein